MGLVQTEQVIPGRLMGPNEIGRIQPGLATESGWNRHRLNADWTAKYGHRIALREPFVDRDRFRGPCYRAAGWVPVGATVGRSRNDRDQTLSAPIKDIYLRALVPDVHRRLCI